MMLFPQVLVEDVPLVEDDELAKLFSVERNLIPSDGHWIEPVNTMDIKLACPLQRMKLDVHIGGDTSLLRSVGLLFNDERIVIRSLEGLKKSFVRREKRNHKKLTVSAIRKQHLYRLYRKIGIEGHAFHRWRGIVHVLTSCRRRRRRRVFRCKQRWKCRSKKHLERLKSKDKHVKSPSEKCPKEPDSPPTKQIFIRSIDGRTLSLAVEDTTSVLFVKHLIEGKTGIPCSQLFIDFGGKPMKDNFTLREYNIHDNATLNLNLCCCRGNETSQSNKENIEPNCPPAHIRRE